MKKSECIKDRYYAVEHYTYAEDGGIYDRDTGEQVARWDEEVREPERELHDALPIGRIDYLGSSGRVRESIEYTDEEQFANDLRKETYYGVPMSVCLYRDMDGQTIPHDYIFKLDPPPKGFSIEDNPYANEIVPELQETADCDYEMEM